MKKLFKAIRQENLEEVKAIIEKKPELVNCTAAPPPKKDNGQSPLQVAIKIGAFDIADYLIEKGADVNFMEAEDDDPGVRAPVLLDAINAALMRLAYGRERLDESERGLRLTEVLLEKGADANQFSSTGMDAWAYTIQVSEDMADRCEDVWDLVKAQTYKILDLLEKHGADKEGWLERHYLVAMEETNRECYIDAFVPQPDRTETFTIRGRKYETVMKGDIDQHSKMREILKKYYGG